MRAGMNGGKQKNVVLILARELASNIATPMLVLDETGTIVFFNEPAEKVLGATFASVGEVPPEVYDARWATTDPDGNELSLLRGPMARVVSDHTPAHRVIRVRGLDGVWHLIETTVYPLFASASHFVGAVGVFWELGAAYSPSSRESPFHTEP
jgi:PAS domain-containing protein